MSISLGRRSSSSRWFWVVLWWFWAPPLRLVTKTLRPSVCCSSLSEPLVAPQSELSHHLLFRALGSIRSEKMMETAAGVRRRWLSAEEILLFAVTEAQIGRWRNWDKENVSLLGETL